MNRVLHLLISWLSAGDSMAGVATDGEGLVTTVVWCERIS